MELLSEFDTLDPVSELLRAVRVRSTVYCRSLMRAPWGFGVEAHGNPAFHVVTSGHAWLQIDGTRNQTQLAAGDLVVLPAGPRHWLRDDPGSPAIELEDILAATPLAARPRLRHGGAGTATSLVCGGFALDGAGPHPILEALAPLLVVRGSGGHPVPWLAATISMLSAETGSDAPGAEEVVARLADGLLTQALRLGLIELQARNAAHLRALQDPEIAFAARFRLLVGESPIRYMTRARLAHAATLLRTSNAPLAEIAARSGYGTPFSFGKAFKRTFGIAPGTYRGKSDVQPKLELAGTRR